MPRIPKESLIARLTELFAARGVAAARARRIAEIYSQASADGVYSHGVHRVPELLAALASGEIADKSGEPTLVTAFGAMERYDGNGGLGALNAEFCIDRAMALSDSHGVGCVALRNTRHWGRPGNCGWRAAEKGHLAICWTNTPPNMPAWPDSRVNAVGNNPCVFAVPGEDGKHLVLDMALSQFSFGKLDTHRAEKTELPVVGGVDSAGNPTKDAAAILAGGHHWPIGFWKGSGLAIVLDAMAAILADGCDTAQLVPGGGDPHVSQVYLAFGAKYLGDAGRRTGEILRAFAAKNPHSRYPGEGAITERRRSEIEGVYVRGDVWEGLADRHIRQ